MLTVWKYVLELKDEQTIMMPQDSKPLSIAINKDDLPVLWCLIDTEKYNEYRTFRIVGTGHKIDFEPNRFIGTFFSYNGNFVWHLFDVTLEEGETDNE